MSKKNLVANLKKSWKKSKVIRPLFWAVYCFPLFRLVRKGIGKIKSMIRRRRTDRLLFKEYPALYDSLKQQPVDENKVIFLSTRVDELGKSFALLYERLTKEYNFDVHVHHLKDTFVPHKEYEANCRKLLTDLATAKYVFIADASNVLSCVDLRPETVVTQLWHACGAFKRWGMSTADKIFGLDAAGQRRHPYYKNLTYVTVSSPEIIWAYAEAMDLIGKEDCIRPVGTSRTDIFFDQKAIEAARAHLYEQFPAAKGKKVILFAPTFRGRVANPTTSMPDLELLKKRLGDEYVVVTKHHPLVRELPVISGKMKSFAYDATSSMTIEDLLMVSDICISDYSSLIFEYSLFERPMLFYAYDLDEYFDWRGFYYNYDELTPGPICRTTEEMAAWIEDIEHTFDKQQVIDFKNKFMSACDGQATSRILELTMGEEALAAHKR